MYVSCMRIRIEIHHCKVYTHVYIHMYISAYIFMYIYTYTCIYILKMA